MKVIRKSNKGDMILLENKDGEEVWFYLNEKVQKFAESINDGSEVNVSCTGDVKGEQKITFLERAGGGDKKSYPKKNYGSKKEDSGIQTSIEYQQILKATAEVMGSLKKDSLDISNVADAITVVFNTFKELGSKSSSIDFKDKKEDSTKSHKVE